MLEAAADCAAACQTSEEPLLKPVVSVYPAASTGLGEGKSALLCLASDMVPPEVRFSWTRRPENGYVEEQPPAEEEQLELREDGRSAAIRLVDRDALQAYKYRCRVQHEGGAVEAQAEQGECVEQRFSFMWRHPH